MAFIAEVLFWSCILALAFAYLIYPLSLLVFAPFTRVLNNRLQPLPSVTLIIPAFNEEKVLHAKLENALALDYPQEKLEIIVSSDGSDDRTLEIAESYRDRGVHLLSFPKRRGKASALNDAAAVAAGDVIALTDANVMFRPDALRIVVERLGDSRVGAATGDVQLASHESNFGHGESLYYRIERKIQECESRLGSVMGVDGGMYVLWKNLFRPIPVDTILDDFVISMNVVRQGKKIVYEPAATASENGIPAARQEFRRRVRVSAGAVQSLKRGDFPPLWRPVETWQFVCHKLLRWISPFLLLLLSASNILLWSKASFYRFTLGAQIVFFLLAVIGAASKKFRSTKMGGISFYFAMSQLAMAVGTIKGLFNLQRVTWTKAERQVSSSVQLSTIE